MKILPLQKIPLNKEVMTKEQTIEFTDSTYERKGCTMIEVFPTNVVIPSGTVDSYDDLSAIFHWDDESLKDQNFTGLTYPIDVVKCDTALLSFHCKTSKKDSDVIIDWGDGTIIRFSEYDFNLPYEQYTYNGDEYEYYSVTITHKYVENVNRKNIVKIVGNDVVMVRGDYQKKTGANIISRFYGMDLSVSLFLRNVSSMVNGGDRFLRFTIPYNLFCNISNWSNMFLNCKSLRYARIASGVMKQNDTFSMGSMFENCENLEYSNVCIPSYSSNSSSKMYKNCVSLNVSIRTLLPPNGFSQHLIDLSQMFLNCGKLYGIVPNLVLDQDESCAYMAKGDNTNFFSGRPTASLPFTELKSCNIWKGIYHIVTSIEDIPYDIDAVQVNSPDSVPTDVGSVFMYTGKSTSEFKQEHAYQVTEVGKYKDFGTVYHDLYFFSEDFDLEHMNSDGTTETRHFKKDTAYGLNYTWNKKINYVEFEDNVILNGDDVYGEDTYYSRSIYTVSKNEDGDYEIQLVSDENDRYRVQSLALNNLTKDIKKYDYFYGVLKNIDGVSTYVYTKDESSGITTGQEGTAFLGCSDEVRRQIPIYLGGTKPNPVVSLPLSGMSIDLDSENLTSTLGLIFETLGAKVEN